MNVVTRRVANCPIGLPRHSEYVRATAPAAHERSGQGRGDNGAAPPDHGPGTPTGQPRPLFFPRDRALPACRIHPAARRTAEPVFDWTQLTIQVHYRSNEATPESGLPADQVPMELRYLLGGVQLKGGDPMVCHPSLPFESAVHPHMVSRSGTPCPVSGFPARWRRPCRVGSVFR